MKCVQQSQGNKEKQRERQTERGIIREKETKRESEGVRDSSQKWQKPLSDAVNLYGIFASHTRHTRTHTHTHTQRGTHKRQFQLDMLSEGAGNVVT